MLRLFLIAFFLFWFLVLGILVRIVLRIVCLRNKPLRDITSLRIVQGAFRLILFIAGVRLTVIGEENVPKDRSVLYIGNHRSFFDIVITYARTPGLTGYIAKKEILKVPLLRDWMKDLYCLFLDRDDIKEGLKTILTAIEYEKQGISVAIFPEGTRNKGDGEDILPFHDGSFKIALKSGCPIVPMTLNNSAAIFEEHFPKIKPARVVLEYGKPIETASLSREEQKNIAQRVREEMLATYRKNMALLSEK